MLAMAAVACEHTPAIAPEASLVAVLDELDVPASASVLVGAGDIASCEELAGAVATAALVRAMIERTPDAVVFTTGDHAYPDGSPEQFEACYEPAWGEFNARTVPAPGNHDYETEGAEGFFGYFDVFRERSEARGGGYYDVTLGAWRIVVLNSLLPLEPRSPQLEWIDRRLDADGRPRSDGARQFTVGTGGADLHPIVRRRRHSEYLTNETYGVLVLILHADGYEWAFVGTDGVVHDRSDERVACST